MVKAAVDIVLATYNGGRFLRAQLDSIVAQSFAGWRLLIRDDGSTDDTLDIIADYVRHHPGRIRQVPGGANLGACQAFARLLESATADYVMLCDQDDVWLPDKVSTALGEMQRLEAGCGQGLPLLVHTDLRVVDEQLRLIAGSGWRYQKTDPQRWSLNQLLVQNVATGCTVMINRTLRDAALPIPPGALMHDWWLALVASAFGRISCVPRATMLYRQHGANQVGAMNWSLAYTVGLLARRAFIRAAIDHQRAQARTFLETYRSALNDRQQATLLAFAAMPEHGPLRRRLDIFRYGIFYPGIVRNLGWLVLC